MEQVKNVAKAALAKLFNPAIDASNPGAPAVIPLTAEEVGAVKLLLSIRGLLPALDVGDCMVLNEVADDAALREVLVNLASLAVDRVFMTVYGV